MTDQKRNEAPVAVWYFIGATFAVAAPSLFFDSTEPWLRLLFVAIALALLAAGFVQLRREVGWGRTDSDEPNPPSPGGGSGMPDH